MEDVRHQVAGAPAGGLSVEALLLRAALLAGHGAGARALARRLAAITAPGDARSCLEAGAPVQLTIDAPGPVGLRIGVRIGARVTEAPLVELVAPAQRRHLVRMLEPLPPPASPSLGAWLFWTAHRASIYVDLRDPDPRDALARLHAVLSPAHRRRLEAHGLPRALARPWALRVEADDDGPCRVHLYWLLSRDAQVPAIAESLAPGAWPVARQVLGHLLRSPGRSGRHVVVTPLDDRTPPALRIASTGLVLVPEDDAKHRAVGTAFAALGGRRDHAEALWSLCRGAAEPRWRVGRACEVRVGETGPRLRLFLTPQVHAPQITPQDATAGTSSCGGAPSSTAPTLGRPSRP
jgi:hypothetical protein